MKKQVVKNTEAWRVITHNLLEAFSSEQSGATVVALSGDLGVGKTTFVQKIAEQLGIQEIVTSPTFTVMKQYQTTHARFKKLFHLDVYRLESESELEPLHFTELLEDPEALICIEWAEKIKNSLPPQTHFFILEINAEGQHTIQSQT